MFMLLGTLPERAIAAPYAPLKPSFETLSTEEKPLPPDFVKPGVKYRLNTREIAPEEGIFKWTRLEDGSGTHCLMILVDTMYERAANKLLHIPKYGLPLIYRERSDIGITWINPADQNDIIKLSFRVDGKEMTVIANSLKGRKGSQESYKVGLPVAVQDFDGEWERYYLPLYAILNEVGGGVMLDPFGDGVAFIYTGGALQGYAGVWEVADDGEYRVDVEMDDKTVSVMNYWWSLELRPDGTFTEVDRHFKDEGGWFRTEFKGRYAFFGRILAMKYTAQSLYFGGNFHNLHPEQVDVPFTDKWGVTDDVYAEYVDDWSKADILSIRGSRKLYSKELSGRKW